jgi:hypothetical protein
MRRINITATANGLMTPPRAGARSYVPQGVRAGRPEPLARRNACGSTQQSTVYGTTGGAKDQPIKTVAHDGTVTFYAYTAKGQEAEKATYPSTYASATTRPALSLATRVVSSRWHPSFNLLTKRAEPGKFTVWTYANDTGNLTAQSETMTTDATGAATFSPTQKASTPIKSTGWAYHATTQLPTTIVERETAYGATAAVERSKSTRTYTATGDLSISTDIASGLKLKYDTYNAHGKPLQATDSRNKKITWLYSSRNKPINVNYDGKTANIAYTKTGELSEVKAAQLTSLNTSNLISSKLMTENNFLTSAANGISMPGGWVFPLPLLETEGCGPNNSIVELLVPDNPLGFSFRPCCDDHDACYGDCKSKPPKEKCDLDFNSCLQKRCNEIHSQSAFLPTCYTLGRLYYDAVRNKGAEAFAKSRKNCPDCKP